MSKIEKEVKVLDIDVKELQDKLVNIGATFITKKNQLIYVYDIPGIYYRFLEIRDLLKSNNELIINTNIKKLEVLLLEFNDLIKEEDEVKLLDYFKLSSLLDILTFKNNKIYNILLDEVFEIEVKKFGINKNKWVRLRKSNEKVELTTKHILEKKYNNFQNVIETEIEVSSFEETNNLLESIGIDRRSYQEKIRYSYKYKDAEIEIDIWPKLNPYMEIECDNELTIEEVIDKLDLRDNKIVSLNTEQLYKEIGIDIHSISELKF